MLHARCAVDERIQKDNRGKSQKRRKRKEEAHQ